MDELDQKLITLLRHNGRRSISDLAVELDVARATVRSRIERLERSGEIVGYTVILKSDTSALPVRGIMMIEVGGHKTDSVLRALNGFSEISAIHTTNGKWDLVAELGAASLPDFDSLLKRIRMISGITSSETTLFLTTPRSTKARL
jgi:DNA-binding Lrp family transcriptional regulator